MALGQHKGQEGFSFSGFLGAVFQDTVSERVNSVRFCTSEYLRHLNPEQRKTGLAMDLVMDALVFGPTEQPQCEQYGTGANRFGGLFTSPLKCRGLYHLAGSFRVILSII